jgi:hypothetical protein
MQYSWQVLKFSTRDQTNADGTILPNAVVRIKWKRFGIDSDGNSAYILGYTNLTAEHMSEESFAPFESLTEEMVISWLESAISTEKMNEFNDKIQEKINKRSTTIREVPWSK